MRKWLIRILYRSLSPCEQYECRHFLIQPSIDAILQDQCRKIDRNWLNSVSYKSTKSKGDQS